MKTGFFRRARVNQYAILGVFIRSRLSDIDVFITKEGNQSITHDTLITSRMSFLIPFVGLKTAALIKLII